MHKQRENYARLRAVPELDIPKRNVRSMPINAAAILASSSSGREDKAVGPGVGIEVGDCVGAGDGARLGEIVGDKVGPGVGADRAEEHAKGQAIAGFVRSNFAKL